CQQLRNEISADACAHFNVLLRQYQLSAAKAFNCIAMVQDMQMGILENPSYQDAITTVGDETSQVQERMQMSLEGSTKGFEIISNLMEHVSDTQKQIVDNLK